MKLFSRMMGILLISLIRFYKFSISPLIMASCRFTPTCSEYGVQAIKKHGPLLGGWYTMRRISSCHPWGRHGHDPVP